jgi:hypothetical protein
MVAGAWSAACRYKKVGSYVVKAGLWLICQHAGTPPSRRCSLRCYEARYGWLTPYFKLLYTGLYITVIEVVACGAARFGTERLG